MADKTKNSVLYDTVDKLLDIASTNCYRLEACLFGENLKKPLNIHPGWIGEILIENNFAHDFSETVHMTCRLSITDFIKLYEGKQDLYMSLILYRCNRITGRKYNIEPIIFEFMAVLKNAEDIFKLISSSKLLEDDEHDANETKRIKKNITYDVTLQLIDETLYNMRNTRCNYILGDATVEDAMRYFAEIYSVEKVVLAPPDNVTEYKNIVVPPMVGLDEVFPLLQNEYNIYLKNIGYFYMDKTLYIYPLLETEVTYLEDGIINVYKIDMDTFVKLDGYSKEKDSQFHIVTNKVSHNKSFSGIGMDNEGTGTLVLDTSKTYEGATKSNSINTEILPTNLHFIGVDNKNKIKKETQRVNFNRVEDTEFVQTSILSSIQSDTIKITWAAAKLGVIKPKHPIAYHYENENGYMVQNGVVDAIAYRLSNYTNTMPYIFKFNSEIYASLTPAQ